MSDDAVSVPPATALASDDRAMTPHELRAALRLSTSTFYHYQSAGKLERFELRPRIGPRRYSRKLVQRYLDGEPGSSRFAHGFDVVKRGVR